MLRLASILLMIVACLLSFHSRADIYSYTDEEGVIHFTDSMPDRNEVPHFRVFAKAGPKIFFQMDRDEIEKIIEASAQKHGLKKELIKAVIKAESAFDPQAVSTKGAIGLMQLLPKTAYSMGVDNIKDPRTNVDAGCKLLKKLLDRYNGDIELSLAAYNAGETAVNKYNGIPPYPETINYVQKVIRYYNAEEEDSSSIEL